MHAGQKWGVLLVSLRGDRHGIRLSGVEGYEGSLSNHPTLTLEGRCLLSDTVGASVVKQTSSGLLRSLRLDGSQ